MIANKAQKQQKLFIQGYNLEVYDVIKYRIVKDFGGEKTLAKLANRHTSSNIFLPIFLMMHVVPVQVCRHSERTRREERHLIIV